MDMNDVREEYGDQALTKESVDPNPFIQLDRWFKIALQRVPEANAATLATVNQQQRPSARVILLKSYDEQGLVFYTNYHSRKAQDLHAHPYACINIWWRELKQQLRIEGRIATLSSEQNTQYFQSRPHGSQLAAIASQQSQIIPDRATLEQRYAELEQRYQDQSMIPCPEFWGGYRLVPDYFEFWQGRACRLHDRICYQLKNGMWHIERLAP
ncbi:MAG: pyridoxamine 5'-phosphate oxidase [Gammaproteobacteria bacterium]